MPYANIWYFAFVQGICFGIDIQWKGDLQHEDDWGFDLYLGIVRMSFMRIADANRLPDYGYDLEE